VKVFSEKDYIYIHSKRKRFSQNMTFILVSKGDKKLKSRT